MTTENQASCDRCVLDNTEETDEQWQAFCRFCNMQESKESACEPEQAKTSKCATGNCKSCTCPNSPAYEEIPF